MALYYFNIYDGIDVLDDVGTELRNANEVRMHMLALARSLIETEAHQDTHWHMEAQDKDENVVGSMKFGPQPQNGAR